MNHFEFLNQEEQVEEFVEEQQQIDQELSEAERRYEMAKYYRVLIKEPFFEEDTPEAAEVVKNLRQYMRQQMAILLGVSAPVSQPKESVFTDEEVAVLKQLTSKFLKKPQLMEPQVAAAPVQERQPTVRKATASPQATKKPAPQPVQQKAQPKVRKPVKIQEKETPHGTLKFNEDTNQVINVTNVAGKEIVQNLTPQARPTGAVQPLPPLNEQAMAIVAARHEADSRKGAAKSIMEKIST